MNPKHAHYVAVTGIIIRDGKFLIAKRSEKEKVFPGQWTVPGGKLELDDYVKRPKDTSNQWYNIFEDVLRREVMEEVGLIIKNVKYLTSLTFIRPDNIPVAVVSLYANHAEGNVRLCDDLTEHTWIDVNEAKNYDLIDGIYEELVMLDRVLKGESVEKWSKKL
tara:strand:+ start:83 stop:571 length:489 start_codon:yes stop_codon:yes gene_type:complete